MDIRRTRLFAYLVVLILLLGQLPVMPVRAIGTDDPILENDEGRIIKTAEPVEGEVNKWKITVRAEYKSKPKPTDLLISLDRSGSMKYGERLADGSVEMQNVPVERQRMTVAKQAISKLADVALAENPDNLMALQSWSYGYNYGTQVFSNSLTEHNDFTHDANAIKGSLDQVPVGGGTFTQKALRMGDIAMGRAKQADTDNKKQRAIVLITDGRPTVGYKVDRNKISNDAWANMWSWQTNISSTGDTTTGNWIQNASDGVTSTTDATYPKYVGGRYYLVGPAASPMEGSGAGAYAPLNAYVSNGNVPAEAFNYADSGNSDIINRIGWGVDLPYAVEGIDGNGKYYYWDIRENTVIEANKVKQSGNFDRLYIIGLTTTTQLDRYLERMATPGDFRATTINNLDDTIQAIYKDLQTEVPTDCSLTDEIGAAFNAPEDIHVTCGNYEVVNADPENGVAGQIKWTIGTPQNAVDKNAFPKVYREELTYTLTMKDGWETLNQDTFSTNGQTSITINKKNNKDEPYDPKNYEAPSPQVQPVKVGIIKKLLNPNGEEIETSDEFNIRLKKDTTQVNGKIKTSETSYFDLTEAGTYTVEEFSEDADGTLPYEVSYKINGQETDTFTIDSTGTVVFSGGQQITSTKNDIMIEVINQERPTPTYKVTYEYESGEAGRELPDEVKALTPAEEPGKADGTKVTPTAPAKTTVETEEGTWTFAGYDADEKTIAGADAKFIGTWNFTPKTGTVNVEYVTEDGEVLEAKTVVKKDAPVGETYTTEQKTFEGYSFKGMKEGSAPATGKVAEGEQTVTYVYSKNETYKVTYEYESGEAGRELPEEVKALTPAEEPGKADGTKVTPTAPAKTTVETEEGTWTFAGYDENEKTIAGADAKFIGTWNFTPKTGTVNVEYVTEDGEVLEAKTVVKKDAPVGETYTTEQKTFEGYSFKGMKEGSAPATGKVTEGEQTVTYVYSKNATYKVTYEYESGEAGRELPDEVKALTPAEEPGKADGTKVTPTAPAKTTVETEEGTWTFAGYDADEKTIAGADAKFIGTWNFTPKTGTVNVEYVTEDGEVLEAKTVVKKDAPVGETYTTEQKTFEGYSFTGMKEGSAPATGKVAEGEQTVTYVYSKNETYKVTYEYESGEAGRELPEEVKALTPAEEPGKADGTKVTPTAPAKTTVETEEGTWTFAGYDENEKTIAGADAKFIGTWNFTPKTGTVNVEYVTEDGEVLEAKTVVKKDAPVGETYTTEQKTFEGYSFKGMKEGSAPATGKVTEGEQTVTYVYSKNATYKVTYEYESGEAGRELPDEVKALTPAEEPGKADGTKVTPTAPAKTTVETEEGTWTFAGYDADEKTIAGADAKFIGTWNFTPKTPATPQSILVKKIDFLTGQGVEGAEFGLMKTSGGGQGGSAGAPVRPRLKSLLETMEAARPDSVAERITAKQAELKTLKEQLAQLQQTIAQEEGKVPEESEPVLTAGEVNVTSGSVLTEEQIVSAITLNGEALPESVQVLIDDSGLSTTEAGIYTVHVTLTFEDASIRIIDVTVVVTEGADAFNSTDGIDSIEGNDIPDEDSGHEPDPESTPNPDPLADPQTESGQDEVTSIDPQEPQAFNGVRLCFTAAEMSDLKAKMAALEAEIAVLEEQIAEDTAQLSDRKEALAQAQIQQTNQSDSLKTSLTLLGYTDEQISACCDPQTGLMQSYLLSPDQVDELMPTDIDMLTELETQIATLQAETLERDAYEALRQSLETAVEAQPVERMIMYAPTPGNGLTPIATGKTNARGELLFDNLEPGSYQIQELNAAAGYVPLTGVDAIWPKDTQGNPASVVVDQNGEQVVIQVVNKPYVNVHKDPSSPMPDGYVRIVFDATEDGTTDGKHRYTVIDVLEGLEWNDPKVTDHFPGNARPNSGDKTFEKWSPDIPTSGQATNSVFVASYKGSPVTPPVPPKPTNEPDTGNFSIMMPLRTQPTVTELVPVKPVRTVVNLPRTGSAQTSAHVFGLIAAVLGAALLAYSKRLR